MSNNEDGLKGHMAEQLQHRVHYLQRDFGSTNGSKGSWSKHQHPGFHPDLSTQLALKSDCKYALPKVWVIGASQVQRSESVALQTYGDNFGLSAHVSWFGKGGMGWAGVMPRFSQELSNNQSPPDVLVLHCGGNDLGLVEPSELVSQMETDLRRLRQEFPHMKLVFSLLHQRQRWRYGAAPRMEQIRKLVNNKLRRMLRCLRCEVVEHENIRFSQKGVFVPDGVHFTTFGNQVFLDSIRQVVSKILKDNFGSEQGQHKEFGSTTGPNRSVPNGQRKLSDGLHRDLPIQVCPRPVFKKIPGKVWVIGASQVCHAEPVAQQTYGDNFGLDARVHWFGQGGMGWAGVVPRFYEELSELEVPPDVLVLHAGGNDLGLMDPLELVSEIETDLKRLRKNFPKMNIIFSFLHERQHWRHGPAPEIEQICKLVNAKLKSVLEVLQCEVVEHDNLRFFQKGVFFPDGVQFTAQGNKVFLENIHRAVRRTLQEQGQRKA